MQVPRDLRELHSFSKESVCAHLQIDGLPLTMTVASNFDKRMCQGCAQIG